MQFLSFIQWYRNKERATGRNAFDDDCVIQCHVLLNTYGAIGIPFAIISHFRSWDTPHVGASNASNELRFLPLLQRCILYTFQ